MPERNGISDHPLNVNLREDAVVGHVDEWLAREFAPNRLSATIRELAAADQTDAIEASERERAARKIAECDAKLALAAGRKLADVRWPPASIPVSVLQADSLHSADQGITLAVGDRVSLLLTATLRARRERLEELRAELGDTAQDYPVCVFLNTNVNPDERRAFDDAAAKWAQQSTRNISAEDLRDIGAIGTPTSAPPSSGRSPRPAPPTSSSSCCPLIRAASSG